MDQEFKPIEDIKPIEISTPNNALQPVVEAEPIVVPEVSAPAPSDEVMQSVEEEEVTPAIKPEVATPKLKSVKKGNGKTIFVILLIILLVAAGAVAYWWRDKTATESANKQAADIAALDAKVKSLEADAESVVSVVDDTSCNPVAPSSVVIESIKTSITSSNTAALEGYMATSVKVILAASEGIGSITPTQAVSNITDFISTATVPWNFAISASVLTQYAASNYGPYFPSIAVVGMSANNKVISFIFDCDGKISMVFMAANQSILQ